MSWLDKVFGGTDGTIKHWGDSIHDFITGETTARISDAYSAESQARAYYYNTQLQEDAQLFNALEAQKARDYSERLSNTAYQRARADLERAGFNPLLAVSNGSASTPSSPAASSSAGSVGSSSPSVHSGLGDIANIASTAFSAFGTLAKLKPEIAATNASAAAATSAAEESHSRSLLNIQQARKVGLEADSIDPAAKRDRDKRPGLLGDAYNSVKSIASDVGESVGDVASSVGDFFTGESASGYSRAMDKLLTDLGKEFQASKPSSVHPERYSPRFKHENGLDKSGNSRSSTPLKRNRRHN